jgi:hypothetical protein
MQNHVYNMEHELKVEIIKNRAEMFNYLKVQCSLSQLTKEDVEKEILSAGIIEPEKAVKFGYIDGIKTVDELIHERYEGIKIHNIQKQDFSNWMASHWSTDVMDNQ